MDRIAEKGLCLSLALLLAMLFCGSVCFAADSSSGLAAQYKFDGNLKDSSGNGNDGTAVGGVSFEDKGAVDKCAVFNGGFVKVPGSSSLNIGSTFTISVWVKVNPNESASNNDGTIIAKENNDTENLQDSYAYRFRVQGVHGTNFKISQLSNGYCPGVGDDGVGSYNLEEKWTLLTCVDDGRILYLYADGKQIGTDSSGGSDVFFTDTVNGDLLIGGITDGGKLSGSMDDLRIYKRALNENEVKKLYQDVMGAYKNRIELFIGEKDMLVDGKSVQIDPASEYTKPVTKDGRTLVPIRSIIESMGGTVGWNGKERRVDIKLKGTTIKLWLDQTTAEVNGKKVKLDVPAQGINQRTMVPVRFVAENLGAKVEWDKTAQKVTIMYNK